VARASAGRISQCAHARPRSFRLTASFMRGVRRGGGGRRIRYAIPQTTCMRRATMVHIERAASRHASRAGKKQSTKHVRPGEHIGKSVKPMLGPLGTINWNGPGVIISPRVIATAKSETEDVPENRPLSALYGPPPRRSPCTANRPVKTSPVPAGNAHRPRQHPRNQ